MTVALVGIALLVGSPARTVAHTGEDPPKDTPPSEPQPSDVAERVEVAAELDRSDDVAAFATRLSGDGIARRGEDLADVLRRVPGARVRDYGGLGSYATMSLRASTSEQVTVLVDGVPQNRALGGPVDLSSIPATQLEEITVFRGFGPAGLGLGGIGGVVDVRTRAPGDGFAASVDGIGGSLDTGRVSGGVDVPLGGSAGMRVSGEWLTSAGDFTYLDGGSPFDPDDDLPRERVNNDVEQGFALVQYRNTSVRGGTLQVGVRAHERERGLPGVDSFPSTTARLDERRLDGSATWKRGFDAFVRAVDLQLDGFDQRVRLTDLDGDIGLAAQDQTTRLEGGGVAAVLRGQTARHGWTLRLESRREQARVRDAAVDASDRGGADRDSHAVVLEDVIAVTARVRVAPSVGWKYRDDDFRAGEAGTVPPPASDVSESAWTGKVGLACALARGWTLRGSVGTFHRSPNLLELFGDRGSLVGNPRLRSEEGDAVEIGAARRDRRTDRMAWDLEVVAFGRRADDLIRFRPGSQGTAVAENVARVEVAGIEVAAGLRFPGGVSLDGGVTRQEATDRSDGFPDGRPLPYEPEWIGFAGLGWRRAAFELRWDVTYTGENSTDTLDTPEARLPERWIHDATLGWRGPAGWEAGLDVRNVLDRETRDLARFPLPDRVVLLHVGWRGGGAR